MIENQNDIVFGNRRLSEFNAKVLSDITISPIVPDTEIFVGQSRSTQQVIKNRRTAARQMTMFIDFFGDDQTTHRNESDFQTLFLGSDPVLVDICDGYIYNCVLVYAEQLQGIPSVCLSMCYTLSAVRRGPDVSVVFVNKHNIGYRCESTFPRTDCRLIFPNIRSGGGADILAIKINGLTFAFPQEIHGVLVIDGINKIITDDGNNITNVALWSDFPYLTPGENIVETSVSGAPFDTDVTVEYHPVYM